MRELGKLKSREELTKVNQILAAFEIESWFNDEDSSDFSIWILLETDLQRASEILRMYRQDPANEEIRKALAEWHGRQKVANTQKRRDVIVNQLILSELLPPGSISILLILFASAVFVVRVYFGAFGVRELLSFSPLKNGILSGKSIFDGILSGQLWRVFSPIFIHSGVIHLVFNLIWLFQLGKHAEASLTRTEYLLLLGLVCIVSHFAFAMLVGPFFGGMSGVVYGICGYLGIMDVYAHNQVSGYDPSSGKILIIFYCISIVLTFLRLVPVANTIHALGAAIGILFGYIKSKGYRSFYYQLRRSQRFRNTLGFGIFLLFSGIAADLLS